MTILDTATRLIKSIDRSSLGRFALPEDVMIYSKCPFESGGYVQNKPTIKEFH